MTVGLFAMAVAAGLALAAPGLALLISAGTVGAVGAAALGLAIYRRPWLIPWGALAIFCTSAELRLRLSPDLGAVKDVFIAVLVVVLAFQVFGHRPVLGRMRPFAGPLLCLAVLTGMYLLDPAGGHGAPWLFGTRLLLEVLVLLVLGLLSAQPDKTMTHLLRAFTVILPLEAVFAWIQQVAGPTALVFQWGYRYGAQVRVTSGGGLRTSGTFEDPFQLVALAVLGLALALFLAPRRQAVILTVAAIAVLGATSVRTAMLQAGLLLIILLIRNGWWRQTVALAGVTAIAALYVLATTTTAVQPGAPQESLLLNLNGRSTAWAQAVDSWDSLVVGHGVGDRGIGSTREATAVSAPPAYDPESAPPAEFAGSSAFLDSSYAQVQSDVGIVGTVALVGSLAGLIVVLVKRCRKRVDDSPAWAALAVLAVSAIDWIGRSSLASYTTGFLTLYVLGVLLAATQIPERST